MFFIFNFGYLTTCSYNSHLQNQARLKALKKREDLIRDVLEDARRKLAEVTKDIDLYQKVLQKLIAQALFRLIEKEVVIRCRKQDLGLVENAIETVKKEYKEATKMDVVVKIDKEQYLSADM